jgi:hypothetical protein
MEVSLRRVNVRTHYVGDKICARAKYIPHAPEQLTPPSTYKPSDLPYQDTHTLHPPNPLPHPPHPLPRILISHTTVRTDDHRSSTRREPSATNRARRTNPTEDHHCRPQSNKTAIHLPVNEPNKRMISRLLRPSRTINRIVSTKGPSRWKHRQTPTAARNPLLPIKPKGSTPKTPLQLSAGLCVVLMMASKGNSNNGLYLHALLEAGDEDKIK